MARSGGNTRRDPVRVAILATTPSDPTYDAAAADTTNRVLSATSARMVHSARSPTASHRPTTASAARWASAIAACGPVRSARTCCTGTGGV